MFEVNGILNNENKDEVKEELKKVINIGIDFKCQENFAEKNLQKNKYKKF